MLFSKVLIKVWEPEDAPGAISVIREVFDEYGFTWDEDGYHADLYDVSGVYLEAGDEFFVARLDGEVVGTVAVEFFEQLPGSLGRTGEVDGKVRVLGADCSMERLYVRPSARKSGIGGALVAHAMEAARAKRRRAMEIWSDKRFETAHRLYGRFGAHVVGDRVCDDPDDSPEWGLLLTL
jgi:putative acetyltransferase